MIEGIPPQQEVKHPDIVYFLYEPPTPEDCALTKQHLQYKYKRALKYSAISFINAHIRRYLLSIHRPLAFDYTASCSNSFHEYELIKMPDIHIYSSVPLEVEESEASKIYVHDLQPVIDLCPIDILGMETPYIPGLKAAVLMHHASRFDSSREFVLADVDIIFYNVKTGVDPKAFYLCGLEYQPLFSFLAFEEGLKVFSNFGKRKKQNIQKYGEYEKYLKIPLECQLFNNGIIKIPHYHIKKFFDLYYGYLEELRSHKIEQLTWPWPFWTAEMFATNYGAIRLAIEDNVPVRRFDPDVMDLVHDINGQYDLYLSGVINL